ncbi:MAG: RimK family alpha-L-glutamate ligase [Myxococcota bacterium]
MIVIISKGRRVWSTRRLWETAKARNLRVRIVSPYKCKMVLGPDGAGVIHGVKAMKPPRTGGAVIPRIGASVTDFGLALLNQFHMLGYGVLNQPASFYLARNKLLALQTLSAAGIRVPRTVMSRDRDDLDQMVERVGGFPLILKLTTGTQGVGVMIAESMESMRSALDALWGLGQNILIQEYVRESLGSDIRVVVVGGEAVAAYRRVARTGEFRSNIHRGGRGETVVLSPEVSAAAIGSVRAIGLDVAGVDILESSGGPMVIEVNASPGLKGVEETTGVDVAAKIIDLAVKVSASSGKVA